MGLMCGARAIVKGLPANYPNRDWLGVVEGWAEDYTTDEYGNELHVLGLALSDPRASYATITWAEVTGGKTWADVRNGVIWTDVISNAELFA